MGVYINPRDMTKEQWLFENGELLSRPPKKHDETEGYLPICLVDNGAFTAAGIAFDQRELEEFKYPDGRPRKWYFVKEEALHTMCPELARYQERS